MREQTLSIIKPDAVANNVIGEIYTRFERASLWIINAKMLTMTDEMAKEFYPEHADRPFFGDLVKYMTSGSIMVQALFGENAIAKHRLLLGNTDPKKASYGTIRHDYGKNLDANAAHGSDSPHSAKTEIEFFFGDK